MPDLIACLNARSWLDSFATFHVHVQNRPAGLFQAVAVEVLHYGAVVGPQDQAGSHSCHPGLGWIAADGLTRRGKIERGPGGALVPPGVRTASELPDFTAAEGQDQFRLSQPGWE